MSALPTHPRASLGDFSPDRQHGAITVRFEDFDSVDGIALTLDTNAPHGRLQLLIERGQSERPTIEVARELDAVYPFEGNPVAGKRRSNTFDEWHDLRILLKVEHIGAVASLRRDDSTGKHEAFRLGPQRPLLEPVRRIVQQLPGGLDGSVQHRDVLTFDERDVAMFALCQCRHQPLEI
jgi:hypothetical protein